MCTTKNIRRAVSLVEVVVSTLLVGTVVMGSLSMLGASVTTQRAANDSIDGPRLANEMLNEIMSLPYRDPENPSAGNIGRDSGESGSSRADFDDVDDYHNWTDNPIQSKDGTTRADAAGWTRSVQVYRARRADGDVWITDTGLKRFKVTVTSPDGVITERRAMRSEWGPLEQPPVVDKQVVTRVQSHLVLGSGVESHRSTNLLNHVRNPNAN